MSRQLLQLVLLVFLVAPTLPTPAFAQCLESGYWCDRDHGFNSTDPVFSGTCQTDWAPGSATIDSRRGMVRTSCRNYLAFEIGMADRFQFIPPLASSYLTIRMRWKGVVTGAAGGWIAFNKMERRWFTPDADRFEITEFADSVDVTAVRFGFDQDFVYIGVGADGSGYQFDGEFQFEFIDLPPGTIVRSCKGYQQEQPTPAIAGSWGSLKAAYR